MTYFSIGDLPVDELDTHLEHYGVKGMKWGVRRGKDGVRPIARTLDNSRFGQAAKKNVARYESSKGAKRQPKRKVSNQEIIDARVRQAARVAKIYEADIKVRTATTKKGKESALKVVQKNGELLYNSRDAKIAAKWTTREKVGVVAVGTLLAPGLGTAAGVGGIILNNRRTRLED